MIHLSPPCKQYFNCHFLLLVYLGYKHEKNYRMWKLHCQWQRCKEPMVTGLVWNQMLGFIYSSVYYNVGLFIKGVLSTEFICKVDKLGKVICVLWNQDIQMWWKKESVTCRPCLNSQSHKICKYLENKLCCHFKFPNVFTWQE